MVSQITLRIAFSPNHSSSQRVWLEVIRRREWELTEFRDLKSVVWFVDMGIN
jgi:hypothetical protein